jgi:hypothetical protein
LDNIETRLTTLEVNLPNLSSRLAEYHADTKRDSAELKAELLAELLRATEGRNSLRTELLTRLDKLNGCIPEIHRRLILLEERQTNSSRLLVVLATGLPILLIGIAKLIGL